MAPPADATAAGPAAALLAAGPAALCGAPAFHDCVPYCAPAPCAAAVAEAEEARAAMTSPASSMDEDAAAAAAAAASLDALLAAAARKPVASDAAPPATHPPAVFATPPLPPAARAVLGLYGAARAPDGSPPGVAAAASALIAGWGLADTFYVYDLGEVARLMAAWREALPRAAPFYAVKCNPEPGIMAMLVALGAGFDCASVQELERAAALGAGGDGVVFANPCKRPGDFKYARDRGVAYTTFDTTSELEKIAAGYPAFKCILRIRCDDETCKINLGLKYGADEGDVPGLLAHARALGLQVVGVSFHVGSGCQNVEVYREAIRRARAAFGAAAAAGFDDMHLLDIGGGFTAPYDAASADLFYRTAAVINGALDDYFPPGCGVRVIAEPGRYFAETSATLFTTILGQRASPAPAGAASANGGADASAAGGGVFRDYWLSDGTYGSFRIQVAVDGLEPSYTVLRSPLLPPPPPAAAAPAPCRLWGDSGRDGDVVHANARLPALRDGDWLAFPYAGAYTICSASNFGGVRKGEPTKLYVVSEAATRDLGKYNDPALRAAAAVPRGDRARAAEAEAQAAAAAAMLRALSFGDGEGGGCCAASASDDDAMSAASAGTVGGAAHGAGGCACASGDDMA